MKRAHTGFWLAFLCALLALAAVLEINSPAPVLASPARITASRTSVQQRSADPFPQLRPLFNALWLVEASGNLHPPDGDNGAAIGPYQLHFRYWFDATHDRHGRPIHPGAYDDCRNKARDE